MFVRSGAARPVRQVADIFRRCALPVSPIVVRFSTTASTIHTTLGRPRSRHTNADMPYYWRSWIQMGSCFVPVNEWHHSPVVLRRWRHSRLARTTARDWSRNTRASNTRGGFCTWWRECAVRPNGSRRWFLSRVRTRSSMRSRTHSVRIVLASTSFVPIEIVRERVDDWRAMRVSWW